MAICEACGAQCGRRSRCPTCKLMLCAQCRYSGHDLPAHRAEVHAPTRDPEPDWLKRIGEEMVAALSPEGRPRFGTDPLRMLPPGTTDEDDIPDFDCDCGCGEFEDELSATVDALKEQLVQTRELLVRVAREDQEAITEVRGERDKARLEAISISNEWQNAYQREHELARNFEAIIREMLPTFEMDDTCEHCEGVGLVRLRGVFQYCTCLRGRTLMFINGKPDPNHTGQKAGQAMDPRIAQFLENEKSQSGTAREMPRYQSHKQVWAHKIAEILDPTQPDQQSDGSRIIIPAEEGYAPFRVDRDYMRKHDPQVGGYFVRYEDGYSSFSPAPAFERGNTRI